MLGRCAPWYYHRDRKKFWDEKRDRTAMRCRLAGRKLTGFTVPCHESEGHRPGNTTTTLPLHRHMTQRHISAHTNTRHASKPEQSVNSTQHYSALLLGQPPGQSGQNYYVVYVEVAIRRGSNRQGQTTTIIASSTSMSANNGGTWLPMRASCWILVRCMLRSMGQKRLLLPLHDYNVDT